MPKERAKVANRAAAKNRPAPKRRTAPERAAAGKRGLTAKLPPEAAPITVAFEVNGRRVKARAHPMARLLDVLREELRLTGTKEGCGEGECGACTIQLNGELVTSCLVPLAQCSGARIVTIEGIAPKGPEGPLHPVQEAFLRRGGAQCGICTPGMIVAAESLLARTTEPTDAELREGLAGNLCRCTGYMKIFEAVREAGLAMARGERKTRARAEVSP